VLLAFSLFHSRLLVFAGAVQASKRALTCSRPRSAFSAACWLRTDSRAISALLLVVGACGFVQHRARRILLDKAEDLANKMLFAFESPTGMPFGKRAPFAFVPIGLMPMPSLTRMQAPWV
jgi:hypothetical protein